MPTSVKSAGISKDESWKIFDRIAGRYDLLNRVLSFGLDIWWRKRLIRLFPERDDLTVIDLATGTADVLLLAVKSGRSIQSAYGIDLSKEMLAIGRQKVEDQGFKNKIELRYADAGEIPYTENTFDVATIAFGIRNMKDTVKILKEMGRVIHKEGRVLILEFSIPQNALIRFFYLLYLRYIVPLLGALFSGNYSAYRYLNKTIETFPHGKDFCALMEEAGFTNVKANPLLFGVATIYQGEKT